MTDFDIIEAVEEFIDFSNIQTYSELARNIRSMHKSKFTEPQEDWYEWRNVLIKYSGHFEAYCKGMQEERVSDK